MKLIPEGDFRKKISQLFCVSFHVDEVDNLLDDFQEENLDDIAQFKSVNLLKKMREKGKKQLKKIN